MPVSRKDTIKSLRISEKNNLNTEIKSLKTHVSRSKNTLLRFKNYEQTDETLSKMARLRDEIADKESTIAEYTLRLSTIDSGAYDDELYEDFVSNNDAELSKAEKRRLEKEKKKEWEEAAKKRSMEFYQKNRENRGADKRLERDMNKTDFHFWKTVDKIPDYMTKNLKNMPNNKGYIYRGMRLYGQKPAEEGKPVELEESLGKGNLRVHVIDDEYTRIYQKKGRRRTLLETIPRSGLTKKRMTLF